LLWALLRRLGLAPAAAWLGAAVFALHPVTVESVAWITERKNVLSGAFYLAAMWTYLRFSPPDENDSDQPRRWRLYALAFLLFQAALFSKTVTATLPAAIALILWWKRGRLTRRDVLPLIPMLAWGIAMGLLTAGIERHM